MDKDFEESLKVNLNDIKPQKIPSSDRDVYTCLKLMKDTNQINDFLLKVNEQAEIEQMDEIPVGTAMNYYYSIGHQLGEAEYSFREDEIGGREFNDRINKICSLYELDFEYLMETVDKVGDLKNKSNSQEEMRKLAQEIEKKAVERREKQNDKEK